MLARLLVVLAFLSAAWAQEIAPGRFIVELDSPPALGQVDPVRHRAELRVRHDQVERLIEARGLKVRARVDTVANALMVEAPAAAALAGLPGVRAVVPVRIYRPFLAKALDNHEVAAAWDLSGGIDKAGEGIKIAILDTGIENTHPGFQPPEGMSAPEGYPRASGDANMALTNAKIIVARSFDNQSAFDQEGHGTAVAMCAAGVRHESPRGVISGVAPRAWLGVYRVSDASDGLIYSDIVLLAFDWAVKDGMDVVNLSFGGVGAFGSEGDTVFESGVRRALDNNILVVNAAGNTPGPMTVDDTAMAPRVIAAGSNNSASSFGTQVVPSTGLPMTAQASSNVTSLAPVMGPMADAEALGDQLGCTGFPAESLKGRIPLIRRGSCNFSVKLRNAMLAGAEAAVVYNSPTPSSGEPNDLITMNVDDDPTIPALFVGYASGARLAELIATVEDFQVLLRFPNSAAKPDVVSDFSSSGPAFDFTIKPDVMATGSYVYTAGIHSPRTSMCQICDVSGYLSVQGTSFSSPITAGAAAVVKAARPGLDVDAYRSMIVNSATPFKLSSGSTAAVMSAGAGLLNVRNAVSTTLAANPVSVSFAAGGSTVDLAREIAFKNLSDQPLDLTATVESAQEAKPALSAETFALPPLEGGKLVLTFSAANLEPGAYQGFVVVKNAASGAETRIPYWYAVEGSLPGGVTFIRMLPGEPSAGATVRVYFRIHDTAGLILRKPAPVLTPIAGGGVVNSVDSAETTYPGSWVATLRLGPSSGPNVFNIQAGSESFAFQITTY